MKKEQISLSNADVRELRAMYRDVREYRNLRSGRKPTPVLPEHGSRVFIAKVISSDGIPVAESDILPGVGVIAIRKLSFIEESNFDPLNDSRRIVTGVDGLYDESTNDYSQICYNFSTEVDFAFGEYVYVVLLGNGYYGIIETPKFSQEGLPDGRGSGTCGCSCISAGDVEVDGVETASRQQVTLPTIRETQTHGYIELPRQRHTLVLNEGPSSGSTVGLVGTWYKDITSELVAYYNSGELATSATDPTGWIEFDKSVDGYTRLALEWTGTVPEESAS